MPKKPNWLERLASVEAKVDILLELLKEIKEDVKSHPSREEYDSLQKRVEQLESTYKNLIWKIAAASGALSVVIAVLVELAKTYLK